MAVEFLLDGLKQTLGSADAARVLAALRRDPLVWTALSDQSLAEKALATCGARFRSWTPGALSLVALDEAGLIETISMEPMKALDAGLRQKAVRAYEETRKKGTSPSNLQDAGLLGLALRERRRLTGSWAGLPGELLTAPSGVRSLPASTWKTPLACLSSFIPDLNDLVGALMGEDTAGAGLEWLAHIILTQSLDAEEQAQRLVQAVRGFSLDNQLHLLKALKFNGLGEVVEKAAVHLASSQAHTVGDPSQTDAAITSLADQAIAFQRTASLHQLAGNPALAEKALQSAFSVLDTIHAGLELQAGSLGRPVRKDAWIEKVVAVLPSEGKSAKHLMGQVGLALNGLDPAERAGVKAGSEGQDPFFQLHEAECQSLLGKKDLSAEIARSAADEFLHKLEDYRLYLGGDFAFSTDIPGFVRSLFQLDQVKEAADVADAAMRVDPSNPELVELASQVHLANDHLSRAKDLATIAVHLQPDNLTYLRHLASVCETVEDWALACRYRKDCLEHPEGGELADQTAYARSALKAGDLAAASQMCEQILADRPDDGTVHGLMGLTRAAQGRDEEALMHFNRATLVASETAEWWLALAEQHEKMGDGRTALETLRAAVLAAPDSGDIHFRLGELYLNGGMNSEALPHLKKAAALKSENSAIAFKLAKALHALGFLSEARQVIDRLKDQWAGKPEIAYEYAVVSLAMDDVDAAIPALEIAAQSENSQPEWLLTYSGLLLNDRIHAPRLDDATRYEHAEVLLQKSLEITPGDVWTSILLAEAMNKAQKFQAAYDLYQSLVELPEVIDKGWMWRIQHGYGLAAIGLGQVEAGITMLQEAATARPDSLEVVKNLTDAYLSAKLDQEAGETAERALEIAPDDHQNLDWFAGVMMHLGKSDRAAEALRCAIELSPEQSELRVRFAQLAIENGDIQDAKDALRKLPELDHADPGVLRQAAFLHLRVQEPLEAIENLEKAVIISDPPDAQLLYDLAKVYAENGRIDDAIGTVQKIPETQQGVGQQVFYADLLAKQKRYQAAMLVIERALKSILKSEVDDDGQLAGIYARTSKWSRELGNVASAFEQVEKALEYDPDDLNLRFLATNLAAAMLLNEKAGKYALLPFEAVNHQNLAGVGMKLAGLSGHLALENDRVEDAQSLYDVCAKIDPEDRWVQSLNARLLVRRGAIIQAGETLQKVIAGLDQDAIEPGDATLWTARAAFEAQLWQESFRLYDTLLAKYSTEARTGYELAKAMVEAAEIQGLCDDLGVTAHAPGVDGKSERFQARLEELFSPVKPLLGIDEAGRWAQRAKLVMGGLEAGGQNFATSIRQAMDAAAMMAALRVMKNIPAAIDTGQAFGNEIPVLVQNTLCLIETDLPAGLETAEKLVAAAPENPLHLALYARAAEQSGDDANALQAIEEALRLWPDEANWQAWAGELALHMDDVALSLKHLQAALTLQPDNAEFATEVGEVLSLSGEYQKAMDVLRNAVALAPESPAAWLGLARAQKGLGLIDEAIQSALRAADIQDGAAEGLIFASKVSQEIGQKDKALEYARGAYYKDPKNAHSIVNLSRILNAQSKAVESLELISQSIDDLGPARELAYERAWLVYQIQGAEAAGALVDQLIEDYPEDSEALALHANVQAELGQLKVAERSAFRSLRLQPNQPGLALALARMNRKAGQLDQAVHLLGQAASMDPTNIDIYLELGQAYIDRREHSLALQAFDKATKIAPKDARGYYHSALILKETKDYTAAEDMLQKAAKFSPEDLVIHRQLVGVMALNLIHKSQEASKAL